MRHQPHHHHSPDHDHDGHDHGPPRHHCGPRRRHRRRGPGRGHGPRGPFAQGDFMGLFGVRRPLRFLAHKLDLDDEQVAQLAAILDDLKTERAQAAVDDRRAQKLYIEALSGDDFSVEKARDASERRVRSAEAVQQAVTAALEAMHALLTTEQRRRMSTLIRSGVLEI